MTLWVSELPADLVAWYIGDSSVLQIMGERVTWLSVGCWVGVGWFAP